MQSYSAPFSRVAVAVLLVVVDVVATAATVVTPSPSPSASVATQATPSPASNSAAAATNGGEPSILPVTAAISPSASGKAPIVLSLKEATMRSLTGSRKIKKAKEDYNAAREETSVARTSFMPTVRFESNVGTLHDRLPSIGEVVPPDIARDRNQYQAQVVLNQPIFSGLHDLNNIRAKNAAMTEQEWMLKATALDVSIQVIELYFTLQLDQAELAAEREVAKLREDQWTEVRNRAKAGRATELDSLESEYAVKAQEPTIKSLEQDIASKSLQLARLMDLPLDQGFKLTDSLSDVGAILGSAKLPTLSEAYAISTRESPKLRTAEQTLQRIDLEYARDSSKHYPDLSFEVVGGYQSNLRNEFGTDDSRTYSGMLKLKVPLFSGLSSFDERRVNYARVASAREDLSIARDDLLQQLMDAYSSYELAESKVLAEKKNTELTTRAVENARNLFRAGRTVQTNVLDSYSRDLTAKKNYAKALYDRIMALAKIRSLTSP